MTLYTSLKEVVKSIIGRTRIHYWSTSLLRNSVGLIPTETPPPRETSTWMEIRDLQARDPHAGLPNQPNSNQIHKTAINNGTKKNNNKGNEQKRHTTNSLSEDRIEGTKAITSEVSVMQHVPRGYARALHARSDENTSILGRTVLRPLKSKRVQYIINAFINRMHKFKWNSYVYVFLNSIQ